jgi:hypothetical protein
MDEHKEKLITTINKIISDYVNSTDMHPFYRKLCRIDDDIKCSVSEELYKEFKIEHQCIYYEMAYGDDEEDADIVVNDCINILERIVNIIRASS